jgi:hypothetical protein
MILLARTAADADSTHHPTISFEGDSSGKDHNATVVGGVNTEELATRL